MKLTAVNHLQILSEIILELESNPFLTFDEVKTKKNVMGVYLVYTHEEDLLYVGSTNKFHIRFGTDLRHESTHTLLRKLIDDIGVSLNDRASAVSLLSKKCKYKISICKTKREAEALEYFMIWSKDPKYNKHK